MVALITRDASSARKITAALVDAPRSAPLTVHEGWPEVLARVADGTRPAVVLVEASRFRLPLDRLAPQLAESAPHASLIVLASSPTPGEVVRCVHSGAWDVVGWPDESERLRSAVEGGLRLSSFRVNSGRSLEPERESLARLTAREREVLFQMRRGLASRAMAERLGIQKRTVDFHRERILAKLGCGSTAEALHQCHRRDLAQAASLLYGVPVVGEEETDEERGVLPRAQPVVYRVDSKDAISHFGGSFSTAALRHAAPELLEVQGRSIWSFYSSDLLVGAHRALFRRVRATGEPVVLRGRSDAEGMYGRHRLELRPRESGGIELRSVLERSRNAARPFRLVASGSSAVLCSQCDAISVEGVWRALSEVASLLEERPLSTLRFGVCDRCVSELAAQAARE